MLRPDIRNPSATTISTSSGVETPLNLDINSRKRVADTYMQRDTLPDVARTRTRRGSRRTMGAVRCSQGRESGIAGGGLILRMTPSSPATMRTITPATMGAVCSGTNSQVPSRAQASHHPATVLRVSTPVTVAADRRRYPSAEREGGMRGSAYGRSEQAGTSRTKFIDLTSALAAAAAAARVSAASRSCSWHFCLVASSNATIFSIERATEAPTTAVRFTPRA